MVHLRLFNRALDGANRIKFEESRDRSHPTNVRWRYKGVVSSRKIGGSSARRDFFATFDVQLNGAPVTISPQRGLACRRCGTAWRLELGLCVSCLLSCG